MTLSPSGAKRADIIIPRPKLMLSSTILRHCSPGDTLHPNPTCASRFVPLEKEPLSIRRGSVVFKVARYYTAGTLQVPGGVVLCGTIEGPFDVSGIDPA